MCCEWHGDAIWCALQGDAVDQPTDVVYDLYTVSTGAGLDAAADGSQAPVVYVSSLLILLFLLLYTPRERCVTMHLTGTTCWYRHETYTAVALHVLPLSSEALDNIKLCLQSGLCWQGIESKCDAGAR